MKRWVPLVAVSLLVSSCLIETIPDSPSNARSHFTGALWSVT